MQGKTVLAGQDHSEHCVTCSWPGRSSEARKTGRTSGRDSQVKSRTKLLNFGYLEIVE